MMKKRGFTLVELLAVIVILAIILAIAIPGISSIINSVKQSTYDNQTKLIVDAAQKYVSFTLGGIQNNTEKIVTIKDLQDNNYLDTNIKDSRTGLDISNKSWIVVKNDSNVTKYIYGYETNGLILQYDGINNGGVGVHNDNNSTNKGTWYDLSGNNYNAPLTNMNYDSTDGWQTDSLKFDGVNDYLTSSSFTALPIFTVQVVLNIPTGTTDSKTTIGFNDASMGTWMGNPNYSWWNSSDSYWNISRSNTKQLQTLIGNVNNLTINLRINNGTDQTLTLGSGIISSIYNIVLSRLGGTANPNNFSYYSIRVYNRALTTTEINHNYEVDKFRFGI